MVSYDEVREKLYRPEFAPTDEQTRRFIAFDVRLRSLKGLQGGVIRNARGNEDPIAWQMIRTFFPDMDFQEARYKVIDAINYGAREMNAFFYSSFGEITFPFQCSPIKEENLTTILQKAQSEYHQAISSGLHRMIGSNGAIKPLLSSKGRPQRFYDYGLLADAYSKVRAIGIGYNILKIVQSSEFVLHNIHYNDLVNWVRDCVDVRWSNSAFEYVRRSISWEARAKGVMSVFSKMVCRGYNMGAIKDLTGIRFVLENREKVGDFLRGVKVEVEGVSQIEGFERTVDRNPEDDPYYDPRFDCDKFILRPSVPYRNNEKVFSNDPEIGKLVGKSRIRLPVEVQVMTNEAKDRLNADPTQVPAHKLYKYRKALAFWQIVNPWEIFGPLMTQDQAFLDRGRII